MISQSDRLAALEVQHNVVALDPDSIMPWCEQPETLDPQQRLSKLSEGFVLAIWKLESLGADEAEAIEQTTLLKHKIAAERDFQILATNIHTQAREKVRQTWPHA